MNKLTLVVPVFNEAGNILPLAKQFADEMVWEKGIHQVIWVNNGSTDDSAKELATAARLYPGFTIHTLAINLGYGGGVRQGIFESSPESTHLAWMPADGQTTVADLMKVWEKVQESPGLIHKGRRTRRKDSLFQQFVSRVYSSFVRWYLRIPVSDVNGLPKIFPAPLLRNASKWLQAGNGFAFDAEMLMRAHLSGCAIAEHPVTFLHRKAGHSSWAAFRLRTYWRVAQDILELA